MTDAKTTKRVYQRVRQAIIRGELPPGSPVVEADLSQRLDVSRTPIREALHQLDQEGYLVTEGQKKQRRWIAPLTRDEARDLLPLLGSLEALAARKVASIQSEPERASLGRELRSINQELAEADSPGVRQHGFMAGDHQFHATIVEMAPGKQLQRVHESVKPHANRYAWAYIGIFLQGLDDSIREHGEMIEAIEACDPRTASDLMRAHWNHGLERLIEAIEDRGEMGAWELAARGD